MDSWFADAWDSQGVVSIDEAIETRFGSSAPWKNRSLRRWLRGLFLFMVAKDAERVVCTLSSRGLTLFLLLNAVTGRGCSHLYILEFFRTKRDGSRDRVFDAGFNFLYRFFLRDTLTRAQVATEWEADCYAAEFRLPRARFRFIPRELIRAPGQLPPPKGGDADIVFASGRNACDWETLFAAARGASWVLIVVCSAKDAERVRRLNADGRARMFTEIPGVEHDRLMSEAAVYALVLEEVRGSSGHVRLARAIEAGIPVVASSVMALQGYLEPDVTGVAVEPGNVEALREAIDHLIDNPELRNDLRSRAYEAGRERSLAAFVEQLRQMVFEEPEVLEPEQFKVKVQTK